MRYSGNICDGCHEVFSEDEDIVVCPVCATPQHRRCYDEKGECVNAHLHAEGFQWEGVSAPEDEKKQSAQQEMLVCPNCKMQNPKGSTECENCGMKFVVFGVNVVESMQEQEDEAAPVDTENDKIRTYEAPFELGRGEGFDYEDESTPTDEKQEPTYFDENDDANIFKGPYPDSDTTIGVRTNTLGLFIRGNADTYIAKYKRSEFTGKTGFNWAAFLFTPFWFFYRKMIKPGIIFFTIDFLISIILAPMSEKVTAFYESILALDENVTEAMINELMAQATDIIVPVLIVDILVFALHLVAGLIANKLYKSYVLRNLEQASTLSLKHEKITFFTKNGGTSFLFAAAAYFAQYALSMAVSYLMY